MRKIFYFALAIVMLALSAILVSCLIRGNIIKDKIEKDYIQGEVMFENNAILHVEVADEESEREQGLMYRNSLDSDKGIVFAYENEKVLDFWMKNTLMPLDIIFIDKNNSIVDIIEGMAPCKEERCKIYSSVVPAKYAIEVNSGYAGKNNIKIGQRVKFLSE